MAEIFKSMGIPAPVTELKFHPSRKFRFDYAWPEHRVAVEINGGAWSGGRHTRGGRVPAGLGKAECSPGTGMGGFAVPAERGGLRPDQETDRVEALKRDASNGKRGRRLFKARVNLTGKAEGVKSVTTGRGRDIWTGGREARHHPQAPGERIPVRPEG